MPNTFDLSYAKAQGMAKQHLVDLKARLDAHNRNRPTKTAYGLVGDIHEVNKLLVTALGILMEWDEDNLWVREE